MASFEDDLIFPTFYSLPTTTDDVEAKRQYYMVAQVKNNMTITKPTLIVTDKSGMDFAVTFEEDRSFDLKGRGLRKGNTIVIPRPRRLEKGPGKKDVLVIEKEDCQGVKVSRAIHFCIAKKTHECTGHTWELGQNTRVGTKITRRS